MDEDRDDAGHEAVRNGGCGGSRGKTLALTTYRAAVAPPMKRKTYPVSLQSTGVMRRTRRWSRILTEEGAGKAA